MKSANNKINLILKITAIYAILMIAILVISLWFVFNSRDINEVIIEESSMQTEYVYVVKDEIKEPETETADKEKIYIVREHMDKIGIFDESGTLIKVLEVYVKTLPEADKRMLEEGFEVVGKKQLNAIIEDYDG
ncbi:MAG: hypothetical protein E7677_04695 [Ruminococcaceae bacterium]|nr:hypothetical protein [Oscillospiraceae bacterium]